MASATFNPATGASLTEYSVLELRYSQLILEYNIVYDIRLKWEIYKADYTLILNSGVLPYHIVEDEKNKAILYDDNGLIVLGDFGKTTVTFSIAGRNRTAIDLHIEKLKKLFPPAPDSASGRVDIRFWYDTPTGVRNVRRSIVVPSWDEIDNNYEAQTLRGLKYLMDEFKPESGGQLIIFHGPPGVGKSFSLRALLHSWKDWCTAEYVLDPENLFGGGQAYMANLVLDNSYDEDGEEEIDEEDESSKWKLLILEDSGELLTADAKEKTGQALSRLLNLVDGLIGQGLRVLVLITTNEDFTKLHPAVSREGRCAAAIRFRPFDRNSAIDWIHNNAPSVDVNKVLNGHDEYTLADLYALTREKLGNEYNDLDLRGIGFKLR